MRLIPESTNLKESKVCLTSDITANTLLREKDNKIIQMGDEISRLAIYEQVNNCFVINTLTNSEETTDFKC